MNGLDYASMTRDELRPLVVNALKADGFPTTDAGQCRGEWNKKRFVEFMTTRSAAPPVDTWTDTSFDFESSVAEPVELAPVAEVPALAEPAKKPLHEELTYEECYRLTGKGRHPDVVRKEQEAAKQPLQGKKQGKQNGVLANGRDAKGVGKFENWCGQVYPSDFAYPAWRALTKTATDVANICRAKMGFEKHKMKKKDPIFHFTVAEAERTYRITRPTFSKAIKLLLDVGFIEHARRGGMPDGVGVKALYRMIEDWKTWEPPARDNTNILKARAARNILPAKGP